MDGVVIMSKHQDKLRSAIERIHHKATAVGKSTSSYLKKEPHLVVPIEDADYTGYSEMADIAGVRQHKKRLPYPPPATIMRQIKRGIMGYYSAKTGKLYINQNQSVPNLETTIVHEMNHRLNRERYEQDHAQLDDPNQAIFLDEWRARLSERFYQGIKPTEGVLRAAARKAIVDNEIAVDMPYPLTLPEGRYVTPQFQRQFETEMEIDTSSQKNRPRLKRVG